MTFGKDMRAFLIIAFLSTTAMHAGVIRAHFSGTSLLLSDGSRSLKIADQVDSHAFHTTIHAVQRRRDTYYVVFGTSEMSRGWPPRNGHCGAGIESFIKWLKIKNGEILQEQEGRYESCFQNRDGWSIKWLNGKLVWSSTGTREIEHFGKIEYTLADFTWTFDPSNPDQGIKEVVEESKE